MTDTVQRVLSGERLDATEAEAAFDRFMGRAGPIAATRRVTAPGS